MSVILANGRPLKPEIRLAQAVSRFEADLSSEQKATFRTYKSQSWGSPPSYSNFMQLTVEIDRRASGKVGGRCFGTRLTSFLRAGQQFCCARGRRYRRLAKPDCLWDLVGGANVIACEYLLNLLLVFSHSNFSFYYVILL
jgi:hypothetical protein